MAKIKDLTTDTPAGDPAANLGSNPGADGATLTIATGPTLAQLAQAGTLFLTEAQARDFIAKGFATVDTTQVEGDTAAVTITEAGRASLMPTNYKGPKIEIDTGVPLPTGTRRRGNRQSVYPIDSLEVGQSFHVAKTKDNPDPTSRLQSTLSGARQKYAIMVVDQNGQPVMETVNERVYQIGPEGKIVKGPDGKRVIASIRQVTRPKMKSVRDFVVKTVDETDPKGPGSRVWRTA